MLNATKILGRLGAWARYRRTWSALAGLPLDVALDLDISRDDARAIAHRAVYGK